MRSGRRVHALARHVGVALITIGPGAVLGHVVQHLLCSHAHLAAIVGVVVGVGVGLVAYIVVQARLSAPELPERVRLRFGGRSLPVSEGAE